METGVIGVVIVPLVFLCAFYLFVAFAFVVMWWSSPKSWLVKYFIVPLAALLWFPMITFNALWALVEETFDD